MQQAYGTFMFVIVKLHYAITVMHCIKVEGWSSRYSMHPAPFPICNITPHALLYPLFLRPAHCCTPFQLIIDIQPTPLPHFPLHSCSTHMLWLPSPQFWFLIHCGCAHNTLAFFIWACSHLLPAYCTLFSAFRLLVVQYTLFVIKSVYTSYTVLWLSLGTCCLS